MSPITENLLQQLTSSLQAFQAAQLSNQAFIQQWRGLAQQLPLPAVYGQVLEDLLLRLESGMAFSQESCSFSAEAVQAQLQQWLEKARAKSMQG